MQISLDGQAKTEASVLALGMFDGVHLGHQVLLRRAKALARQQRVPLVACTFTEHPMALIAPEKCPPMLTTLEERAQIMGEKGVDILCAQPFDHEMMETAPEAYIARLCQRFHPRFIVAGYNFTFGRKGEGNPALLDALGEVFGFGAQVIPQITFQGEEVSSTAIRGWLLKGQVGKARALLGRPYQRQAAVTQRVGESLSLVMPPNGKLDVPSGDYSVFLQDGQRTFPATLRVVREGRGRISLPQGLPLGSEVTLRFYR